MSMDISNLRVHELMDREWTAVNQLGGYASSSVAGINTRKYHGLLVAAMQPPLKRMVILSRVEDAVIAGGRAHALSSCEYPGGIHPAGHQKLRAFSANPYPRWAYQGEGWTIEKNLRLIPGENTAIISYTLLAGDRAVQLEVKPLFALRGIHELMYQWNGRLDAEQIEPSGQHLRIASTARTPDVYFAHNGEFWPQPNWYLATIYRREIERGYSGLEDLWMPGACRWQLTPGKSVHFACSTEPIELDRALSRLQAPRDANAATVTAILQDTDLPPAQSSEETRHAQQMLGVLLRASGQFVAKTSAGATMLLARFPWSPVLVRDALIGFPGTLLVSRRFGEAKSFLYSLIPLLHEGLLPSSLPEDGSPPIYMAADTSLWFIHAIHEYLRYTDDYASAPQLYDAAAKIVQKYRAGTSLGIQCDVDGLILTRWPGMPTTWMDAKCADWVITPRHGRPVELQALWFNALRTVASLAERFGPPETADELTRLSMKCKAAFNERFWNASTRCLNDVVLDKGADESIRPNQLLAISLPFPILAPERHATVLERVRQSLLTPMGLRSLAPEDPSYQGRHAADIVSRDRSYHQGCAFPWLLGPFISAMLRTYGQSASMLRQARDMLAPCIAFMETQGAGQLPELFDGDLPQRPGGAVASICSTGELLRAFTEDLLQVQPHGGEIVHPGGRR